MSPTGTVIARVFCGLCGERPCEVGWVETRRPALVWLWIAHDPRSMRPGRTPLRGGDTLRHPDFPNLDVPARLLGHCRRHGWGHVDTDAVLKVRGTAVLPFSPKL